VQIDTKVFGEGKYAIFLKQCPECGSDRKLNEVTLSANLALVGVGSLTTLLFGAPIIGALGALGLVKLVIAGTISAGVGARLIKMNYEFLRDMPHDFFNCPKCKNSSLVLNMDPILNLPLEKGLHYRRSLAINNKSKYTLKIYVIYYTMYADETWGWSSKKEYIFAPGQYAGITDGDFLVNARFVYIWAKSIPQTEDEETWVWNTNCCRPIEIGQPYVSNEIEDYTHTFA
jgi:hypothetical protein